LCIFEIAHIEESRGVAIQLLILDRIIVAVWLVQGETPVQTQYEEVEVITQAHTYIQGYVLLE
jgi:hypothetical protein